MWCWRCCLPLLLAALALPRCPPQHNPNCGPPPEHKVQQRKVGTPTLCQLLICMSTCHRGWGWGAQAGLRAHE